MSETLLYCIYHSRDLDGWMSAAIVMKWWEEHLGNLSSELKLIGWDYGDPIPVLGEGIPVIMADVSFPMKDMEALAQSSGGLTWIDHHKSAIVDYINYITEDFMKTELPGSIDGQLELVGACELTWRHLFPDQNMPEIVRLLGCYDSFRHKGMEESDMVFDFQYAARAYMENPRDCYNALQIGDQFHKGWAEIGRGILLYLNVEAKSIYKKRMDFERDGKKIAVINRERFNPSSHDIPYHEDGYDYFMCYSRMGDGRWTVSLYNENGDVDVSVIAKEFGGGGHARAAGFVSNDLNFLEEW